MSTPTDGPIEVLTLALDGNVFALEATHVREILDLVAVTEVPTADRFVPGLINVRGKVVPLADLRHVFAMPTRTATVDTRIVVVEIDLDGDAVTIGLLADKVYEVTQMAAASLEDTPRIGMTWRHDFIRCIAKRGADFVVVLDLAAVLTAARSRRDPAADPLLGRTAA